MTDYRAYLDSRRVPRGPWVLYARDRDGARSAETACPAPVPQDRQARPEGIAKKP